MKKKYIIFTLIILFTIFLNKISFASNLNTDLYAESAILMDSKTGAILFEKNSEKKMYPASITKIVTAIIALEKCNINDTITVTSSAISTIPQGYSTANLVSGEKLTINDLLKLFLVHSANEVGQVLAEHISGDITKFPDLMNEKVREIGCKNTHFTNSFGMHNENHYTTAFDLAKIAAYCMKNPNFRAIVSLQDCTVNATNKSGIRKYTNTNLLLKPSSKYYVSECVGIKTGYTTEAKNCLVSAFSKDNLNLISVVLGCETISGSQNTRFSDSKKIYEYGYTNYSVSEIKNTDDIITNIEIKNGTKDTKSLDLNLSENVNILKNINENYTENIELKEQILAPIKKGDILGQVTYTSCGITYTYDLVASHDVEKISYLTIYISAGVAILFILLLILKHNKKKKRRNK